MSQTSTFNLWYVCFCSAATFFEDEAMQLTLTDLTYLTTKQEILYVIV
jgi:hypothetical protein